MTQINGIFLLIRAPRDSERCYDDEVIGEYATDAEACAARDLRIAGDDRGRWDFRIEFDRQGHKRAFGPYATLK